ncbi:hypothetical protein CEE37_13890 [candidate division LCP-89 bacterium B3_LCP]|uniref:Putative regulatory protein FmdB zinc ribbon domain-containing protein n=1 Tax=candidate division LCP-89 bacterium B3_LCP TaxID=2012998 RepID=A0A532URM2_UNCL8|nr:MAG: hypothetical protein CEE37_13890 [candidate division LCP-89 bacterium B3_LCP]
MPIFEYHCPDCRTDFEELRTLAKRDDIAVCPNCKSRRTERKVSTFSASGFGNSGGSSCVPGGGFT